MIIRENDGRWNPWSCCSWNDTYFEWWYGNHDVITRGYEYFCFFLARVAAWFGSDDEDGGGYNFFLALILEILFGILWSIVVNQFSQYREFRADAGSAKLLGEKNSMIKALQKLQIITRELDTNSDQLATMKIFWHGWWLMRLFATHPSLEKRIAALESI